jgi:ERCC4-type nuclease
MFRDKMHIIFTQTVQETAKIVCDIFGKCQKNPQKFVATDTDYLSHVKTKKCKAENIDKQTCYILQLCQIPMISHIIAKEIASRYPSWKVLIAALDATDNKMTLLTTIPMIGSKKAQMIIEYLE